MLDDARFLQVTRQEEFVALNFEDVSAIVGRDDLYIPTEEVVFTSVIEWTNHDVDARSELLPQLLALVRLPLLTPAFLADVVARDPLVKASLLCRDLVDEAKGGVMQIHMVDLDHPP